jgi:GR25 family glycosyltransferase involved in LPS biosynthesis
MEGGIHVYCINLKHRTDRWERFSKQPEFQQLMKHYTFERYEAINGSAIDIMKDDRISLRTKRNVKENVRRDHEELDTAGGVGCYLSHTNVWKQFLERPEPYAMILEDDAYLHDGFVAEFQAAMKDTTLLPQMPDIWYFNRDSGLNLIYTPFYYDNKGKPPPDTIKQNNLGPWVTQICSNFTGYLISKAGAEKLLETAFPLDMHVDLYTCLVGDLKRIFPVVHRGVGIKQISVKSVDSDIRAENSADCAICNIPTKYEKHGIVMVNVPLVVLAFSAVGIIYYLRNSGRR